MKNWSPWFLLLTACAVSLFCGVAAPDQTDCAEVASVTCCHVPAADVQLLLLKNNVQNLLLQQNYAEVLGQNC